MINIWDAVFDDASIQDAQESSATAIRGTSDVAQPQVPHTSLTTISEFHLVSEDHLISPNPLLLGDGFCVSYSVLSQFQPESCPFKNPFDVRNQHQEKDSKSPTQFTTPTPRYPILVSKCLLLLLHDRGLLLAPNGLMLLLHIAYTPALSGA